MNFSTEKQDYIDKYMEPSNTINAIVSMFLFLIGLFGNSLAMLIIVYSISSNYKKKSMIQRKLLLELLSNKMKSKTTTSLDASSGSVTQNANMNNKKKLLMLTKKYAQRDQNLSENNSGRCENENLNEIFDIRHECCNSNNDKHFSSRMNFLPKISSKRFLALFILTNIVYLIVHFYSYTLNRLIYLFNIDLNANSWYVTLLMQVNLIDTSLSVCKLVYYIKNVCRLLNSVVTAAFSIERFAAVYFPLKLIHLKLKYSYRLNWLYVLSIFFSLIFPLFLVDSYDLNPIEEFQPSLSNNKSDRLILKSKFFIGSIAPTYMEHVCHLSKDHYKRKYYKLHSIFVGILLLFYITVSLTIILIVIKLRKSSQAEKCCNFKIKFVSSIRSNPENENARKEFNKKLNQVEFDQSLTLTSSSCTTQANYNSNKDELVSSRLLGANKSSKNKNTNTNAESNLYANEMLANGYSMLKISSSLKSSPSIYVLNRGFKSKIRNRKSLNNILLLSISIMFLFTNFPYYVTAVMYFLKKEQLKNSFKTIYSNDNNTSSLDYILKFNSFFILFDLFQPLNHSISSLLLFITGKLFRMYFKSYFKSK